ncbi:MAG: YihY family inner membrane protein [Mariprofundales bacterium]|nr:YihY family inner membrane protein [Mariprofundales bacterium]
MQQFRLWSRIDVADVASLPVMKRCLIQSLWLILRTSRRFVTDKCIQRASALAYASLLAIVPLTVLGVSVFTGFQAFGKVSAYFSHALLDYLVPTSRMQVELYLSQVSSKATELSLFGIAGLLVTATALINTMEEAFNHIWGITRSRSLVAKFITFWSVLTLSPILVGLSISITSYFAALPLLEHVTAGASAMGQVPFLLPWLISSLAMMSLYMALPNTNVPFRFAVIGGLIAGAMFEATKFGFTFYVTELAHYEKLYGALGTLPVFLLWLYLVWAVVLLGAEFTFCLQHPEQIDAENCASRYRPGEVQFYRWLILLRAAQRMRDGRVLLLDELVESLDIGENVLQEWLDDLVKRRLLKLAMDQGNEGWLPGRDAASMQLLTVHRVLNPSPLEVPEAWRETPLGRTLAGLYFRMAREQNSVMGRMVLQDLMRKEQRAASDEEARFLDESE